MKVVLENELAERRTIGGREQDAGWGRCSLVVECLLSIPGALGSSPRTGWCVSAGANQTEGYVRKAWLSTDRPNRQGHCQSIH